MYIEIIAAFFLIQQTVSLSYPIFGTKRYHRAGNTKHLVQPVPAYNAVPQYYDEPPYVPVSAAVATYPEYQDDASNSYYYLPANRESHYYGLPTYRGEYKPTPYYYAQGPSYSYYDDRQEQANPLDDLHEEMLQEDQRERQRELPTGQETWYDKSGRQDKLTNAFLKNLIMYNNQMNNGDGPVTSGSGVSGLADFNKQRDFGVEDYDRSDFGDDYGDANEYYEPQHGLPEVEVDYDAQPQQQQQHYDNMQRRPMLSATQTSDDDENVRELKLLAKNKNRGHKNEQRQSSTHYGTHNNYQLQKQQQQQPQIQKQQQQKLQQQQQLQHQQQRQPQHYDYQQDTAYNGYDSDPEYDDEWINWDRKRSSNKQKHIETIGSEISVRKPSPVAEHFQQAAQSHFPTVKPILASPRHSSSSSSSSSGNIADDKHQKLADADGSVVVPPVLLKSYKGQKEVVLPRPATPVRHPFSSPVMDMLTHNSIHEKRDTKTDRQQPATVYDTIKQLLAMESSLKAVSNF